MAIGLSNSRLLRYVIIWESLPGCNSETSMCVCKCPQGLNLMVFRESLTHNNKIGHFTQHCGSCCFLFECCYYHQFIFILVVSTLFQEVKDLILFSLQSARNWTHAYLFHLCGTESHNHQVEDEDGDGRKGRV